MPLEEEFSASEEEDAYYQQIGVAATATESSLKISSDTVTTSVRPSNEGSRADDCLATTYINNFELRSNFEPAAHLLDSYGSTRPVVHPTARVSSKAVLGERVVIGPYSVVEAGAVLHDGVQVLPHAILRSFVEVGKDTQIFSFADVGRPAKDRNLYPTTAPFLLKIGERCHVREYAVIENGTTSPNSPDVPTIIADECLIMASATVHSGAQLERKAVVANQSSVGAGSMVSTGAIIGGRSRVLPGVVVGRGAMIGGLSELSGHVVPHGLASGRGAVLKGLNLIGLRRSGTPKEEIRLMQDVFHYLFEPSVTQSLTRNRFFDPSSYRPYRFQDRLDHVLDTLPLLTSTPPSPSPRRYPSELHPHTIPSPLCPTLPAHLDESREQANWPSSRGNTGDAQPLSLERVQEMLDFIKDRAALNLPSVRIQLLHGHAAVLFT